MRRFLLDALAWCILWIIYWISLAIFALRLRKASVHDGKITILNGAMPGHRDEFPAQVILALRLLDQQDPRRAQMVRNNLRVILDAPIISSLGQYGHEQRLCLVNYDALKTDCVGGYPLDDRIQAMLTIELASLLVHEATHGRLLSRGIAYTNESWMQCERICFAEEARFRNRVCGDQVDLRGRQIDWHMYHCVDDTVKEYYLATRASSYWDRLAYRFRAAAEVVRRRQEGQENPSVSVLGSAHREDKVRSWPEWAHDREFASNRVAFTPAVLEISAYALMQSGLPVAALERFELIGTHGWEMPWLGRYCHGSMLQLLKRYQEAISVFRTIEGEQQDEADTARLQIAYCLCALDQYEQAETMLASIELESIVETQSWFHLYIALTRNEPARALEILKELLGDSEPEDPTEEEFYIHALRPYLSWLLGRQSDARSQLPAVLEARQRWLSDNADTIAPRRALLVHVNEAIHELSASAHDADVLFRADQDVTEEQLSPARELATRIREMARASTSNRTERTLQGLLYGHTNYSARQIDWDSIDASLRLEGTWFVAELAMDRLFLENGRPEGDLLDVWVNRKGDQPQCILQGEMDLSQPIEQTHAISTCVVAVGGQLPYQPTDFCQPT